MPQTWQKLLPPQSTRRDPLDAALRFKQRIGAEGTSIGTALATGEGWRVAEIVCTAGPRDRPFEERHGAASISLVLAGTFIYRGDRGSSLMSAGSLLLGSPGQNYECSHQHGAGDHCLSFQFEPELIERLAHEAHASISALKRNYLPPSRALAPLAARAALAPWREDSYEEIAYELAGSVLTLAGPDGLSLPAPAPDHHSRVSRVVRAMEASIDAPHPLDDLAEAAGISRYHFLRTFKGLTGVTPHRWLLRARLRDAARRLATTAAPITEIALDVGFEDLSNFIRSFRAEFGVPPSRYRSIGR
jgi:AraC family transcriptional regulator